MPFRHRRLGLRARITLAFALGSLLLSVTLSSSTWAFTRQSQLNQRQESAIETMLTNAARVRSTLLAGGATNLADYLASLPTRADQVLAVPIDGEPTRASTGRGRYDEIPAELRLLVGGGQAGTMRYRDSNGDLVLAVGANIPAAQAEYYEVLSLVELERSFELLGYYLTAASLVTVLAGATLGWWASRRTLLPLADVGVAAEAIAGGRLDTRLESADDPDLAILVASFNDMAAALQDRIERDARFASDVSHELRSPLMTLAASIEVLQTRRDEMPERSRAALDLLVHDVNRFQQLVADLLEISRFDSGAVHLELDPVLLAEFLEQAVRVASHDTGAPSVPVVVSPSANDPIVLIDKRRMARVIANLLDNAAKYAGGATSVQLTANATTAEIAVEDTGEGVAPEDRSRIFERFSRGSTAGARGADSGTGLGLALVSEHVRLHGGSVRVENRSDGVRGSRFVVQLPIASEADLSDDAPTLDQQPHDTGIDHAQ